MSATYANDPMASDKDAVRFRIGDTASPWQFSDAEINYLIVEHGTALRAAAQAARQLSARYSNQLSRTVGSLHLDYATRARNYAQLADELQRQADRMAPGTVLTFGVTKSEKDGGDDDLYSVNRGIEIDLHRNPRQSSAAPTGTGALTGP
jgi:hypothetical protein